MKDHNSFDGRQRSTGSLYNKFPPKIQEESVEDSACLLSLGPTLGEGGGKKHLGVFDTLHYWPRATFWAGQIDWTLSDRGDEDPVQ